MIYYIDHSNLYHNVFGDFGLGFIHIKSDDPDDISINEGSLLILHTQVLLEDWINFANENKEIYLVFIGSEGNVPCAKRLQNFKNISLINFPIDLIKKSRIFQNVIDKWQGKGANTLEEKNLLFVEEKRYQTQDISNSDLYDLCNAFMYWYAEKYPDYRSKVCSLLNITELPELEIPYGTEFEQANFWKESISDRKLLSFVDIGACSYIKEFAINLLEEKPICFSLVEKIITSNTHSSSSYLILSKFSHDFANIRAEMKRFIRYVQEKNIEDISNEDSFKKYLKNYEQVKEFFYGETANNHSWYGHLEHLLFLRQSKIKILSNNALEYLSFDWPTDLKNNIHQESFQTRFLTRLELFGQILKQMKAELQYER